MFGIIVGEEPPLSLRSFSEIHIGGGEKIVVVDVFEEFRIETLIEDVQIT